MHVLQGVYECGSLHPIADSQGNVKHDVMCCCRDQHEKAAVEWPGREQGHDEKIAEVRCNE